jgi:hypothetical protein
MGLQFQVNGPKKILKEDSWLCGNAYKSSIQSAYRAVRTRSSLLWANKSVASIQTRLAMYVYHSTEAHARNHCCRGKGICIEYYVFVALVIQHSNRMRRIILSSMAGLTPPHFSTLSHIQQVFRKQLSNLKSLF